MGKIVRCFFLVVLGSFALLASTPVAHSEPFVDLYLGWAMPQNADVKHKDPRGRKTLEDMDFDSTMLRGGRIGWWFSDFAGAALEVSNFAPDVGRQTRVLREDGTITRDEQERLDITVTVIALNLIGQYGFLREASFPAGRIQVFGGGGPGIFITRMTDTTDFDPPNQSHTDSSFGVDAKAGIKFFLTKNWAAFVQYGFTHHSPESTFRDFPDRETVKTTLNVHSASLGISFHFGK